MAPWSSLVWRSNQINRVVSSTLAAETQSLLNGSGHAAWIAAYLTADYRRRKNTFESLVKQILQSPNKDKLMAELFPKDDDKEHQEISEAANNMAKEQGNLEAHAILMITHTVRCKLCYNYATSSVHTYCNFGFVLLAVSDEVKKQVLKNVINCFSMLTSSALVFKQGQPWGKTFGSL